MKQILLIIASVAVLQTFPTRALEGASVTVGGQTAGATPFISQLNAIVSPSGALASVQFTIAPKPGSVTRPISATYTAAYLASRGYLNSQTGALYIPVFGLYPNYANTVSLNFTFTDQSVQQSSLVVNAAKWSDPCGQFNHPTVLQARSSSTNLSYDYFMIKNDCGSQSPVIMDTDGAVRWVGTAGLTSHSSMFFANGIYISSHSPTSSQRSGLTRMEFDGTMTFLQDYSPLGVTSTGHHNFDRGREGMLLELDTTTQTESVIMEVDGLGNPLRSWSLADIISNAMTTGGDDLTQFVHPAPNDWFHNNAATYRTSDDSLIVSSRENFVIALDYDSGAIKWILGDPTKQWYQFPSLRAYALNLGANTLPPIGQHAISVSKDDDLLLFDDGQNSADHTPPGTERNYSAPRKYQIDQSGGLASELWNYSNGQTLFSYICSSIYEDAPLNYLIDYADIINLGNPNLAELVGLDATGSKIFDYRYTTTFCSTAWNAIPVHLEAMRFATVDPVSAVSRKVHGTAGFFDINLPLTGAPGVECRSGGAAGDYEVVVTFSGPVTVSSTSVTTTGGSSPQVLGDPHINGNQVTIDLTGVGFSQSLMINLIGLNDGTNLGNASIPMNVILADINGDGVVDKRDLKLARKTSKRLNISNFRSDVTVDGVINKADAGVVKANLGRVLGP